MGNAKSAEKEQFSKEKKKGESRPTGSRSARPSFSGPTRKPLLTAPQRAIIKYCLENAKDDIAERIVRRTGEKKDDYRGFIDTLPKEQRVEFIENLKEFLTLVGNNLMDSDFVQKCHVVLRCYGFKPDFFAGTADAVTTECTFLDGASHPPSETAAAWSQLSSFVFSAVRDGYYQELRRQRKSSTQFKSRQSMELSSSTEGSSREEEGARRCHLSPALPHPLRSTSPCPDEPEHEGSAERPSKEGTPNFLLPPTVY